MTNVKIFRNAEIYFQSLPLRVSSLVTQRPYQLSQVFRGIHRSPAQHNRHCTRWPSYHVQTNRYEARPGIYQILRQLFQVKYFD